MRFLPTISRTHVPGKMAAAFLLAVSLISSSTVPALASSDPPLAQSRQPLTADTAEAFLDDFFSTPYVEPYYVGASVVIVQGDQIIAEKGYGYADLEEQTPVDPAQTVFRVASVSKSFTAAAIMQLAEQGKIDLQADIRNYLDGIKVENPFDRPVTVEDLLTHRSGFEIRDPFRNDLHEDFDKYVSIEEYVQKHMPPVVREPGSSYMYDNFAYLLLGLIVQEVSGEPYEDYMQNHIFDPLGMENSGFLPEGELLENMATGYDGANQPIGPYATTPTIMPHGGMLTTAEDIGAFMIALLNQGEAPSGRILSEESVDSMYVYRSAIHPVLPDTTYGFEAGFQIPEAGSSPSVVTKAGDLPGFSSYLVLIPEHDTGVFLTYNKQGGLRNLFYPQFLSAFFPEYTAPAELTPEPESSVEELAKLNGLYSDLRIRSLVSTVTAEEDGVLTISDAFLGPRQLHQVDDNLFIDEITRQFTAFETDGNSVYMKEPYLNPLGYAQKGQQPSGFRDVAADDPYAHYILSLQSLNLYPNEQGAMFYPHQPVKKGEFVRNLLLASGYHVNTSDEYAFSDIKGHPDADYIQAAYEIGMVSASENGKFQPNRVITRQEAAVMNWRLLRLQYPDELFADVKLSGKTDEWAVPAVKMMVALGYHGPEVDVKEDGSVDFQSVKPMNRQEEAALLYQMLTKPINEIITERMEKHISEETVTQ